MSIRWLGRLLRNVKAGDRHSLANHATLRGVPATVSLESAWFQDGEHMPLRSAGLRLGPNISPPLTWSNIPAEAVELAIVMEDLDVPMPRPVVHMFAGGIAAARTGLAEGALVPGAPGLYFGKRPIGTQAYMGPEPLPGHGAHRYVFYLLALNRRTEFASRPKLKPFLNAIAGSVIAYGRLIGIYQQP